MIRNFAEFLEEFRLREKKKLDEYNLKHAPTIGEMYEGLTSNILARAIPSGVGLKIVSGFIHDGKDKLSRQIDCMLVQGDGQTIPYTGNFKWHIKDVIAVFEIKKNLYSNDLVDSFELLREVVFSYGEYVRSCPDEEKVCIDSVIRTFEQVTGSKFPGSDHVGELPFQKEFIFHCLMMDLVCPIRIVIGYDGFKSESALRGSLNDFLSKNSGSFRFAPATFPQLMISGKFSLVKANGQPFQIMSNNKRWCFYASAHCNPVLLLLEFIWTRLCRLGISVENAWGEDLVCQNLAPLLYADADIVENEAVWRYTNISFDEKQLREMPVEKDWKPYHATQTQAVILHHLCAGKMVRTDDSKLLAWLSSVGENIDGVLRPLFDERLVVLDGKEIKLTTETLTGAILPTGEFVVGENNSGRLTNWLAKQMKNREDKSG